MTSGKQAAERNAETFLTWMSSKTDDDFKEYVFRGKLNRKEIAVECGFGKSALNQNPVIKSALLHLEDSLREKGVLPTLQSKLSLQSEALPDRDKECSKRMRDSQRLNSLEQQNVALRAKIAALEAKLKELSMLDEFLTETGRVPR